MTRRSFLSQALLGITALAALPSKAWALVRPTGPFPSASPLTIANILVTAFPEVKKTLLRRGGFMTVEMVRADAEGRILRRPLGAMVEEWLDFGKGLETRLYDVEQIAIPILWKKSDDLRTEMGKVNLVSSLLTNAFAAHDALLAQRMGDGRAVVSREYCYVLGCVQEMRDGTCVVKLYTGAAFLPAMKSYRAS